jgi:hypothetical protein
VSNAHGGGDHGDGGTAALVALVNEIGILTQLNHPNIVRLIEVAPRGRGNGVG